MTDVLCEALYGSSTVSRAEYIKSIEGILVELQNVPATIPDEHKVDFSQAALDVTRAGASLYLMLYQVVSNFNQVDHLSST